MKKAAVLMMGIAFLAVFPVLAASTPEAAEQWICTTNEKGPGVNTDAGKIMDNNQKKRAHSASDFFGFSSTNCPHCPKPKCIRIK